jgi:carbon storage regulator
MLVLSRKVGEKIHIGDDIVLTVVYIDKGKVRLGVDAPRNVSVLRDELLPAQGKAPSVGTTEGTEPRGTDHRPATA